jgi:hypothetical protein
MPGYTSEIKTFGSALSMRTVLTDMCHPLDLKIGTILYVDNSVTSFAEGAVVSRSRCCIIPFDEDVSKHWWILQEWV